MDNIKKMLLSYQIEFGIVRNIDLYNNEKHQLLDEWWSYIDKRLIIFDEQLVNILDMLININKNIQIVPQNDNLDTNIVFDLGPVMLKYCALILENLKTQQSQNMPNENIYQVVFQKCLTLYNNTTKRLLTISDTKKFVDFINNDEYKSYTIVLLELALKMIPYDVNVLKNFWLSTKKIIPKLHNNTLIYGFGSNLLQCIHSKLIYIQLNSNSDDTFTQEYHDSLSVLYKVLIYYLKFHSLTIIKPISKQGRSKLIQSSNVDQLLLDVLCTIIDVSARCSNNCQHMENIDNNVIIPLFKIAVDMDKNALCRLVKSLCKISDKSINMNVLSAVVGMLLNILTKTCDILYKQTIGVEVFEDLFLLIENTEVDNNFFNINKKFTLNTTNLCLILLGSCYIVEFPDILLFFYFKLFEKNRNSYITTNFISLILNEIIEDIISSVVCNFMDNQSSVDHLVLMFHIYTKMIAIPSNCNICLKLELMLSTIFWSCKNLLVLFCNRIQHSKSKLFVFQLLRHLFDRKSIYFIDTNLIELLMNIFYSIPSEELSSEHEYIEGILSFTQMLLDTNQRFKNNFSYENLFVQTTNKLIKGTNNYEETSKLWKVLHLCLCSGLSKNLTDTLISTYQQIIAHFVVSESSFINYTGVLVCTIVCCNERTIGCELISDKTLMLLSNKLGTIFEDDKNLLLVTILCAKLRRTLSFCQCFEYSHKILHNHPHIVSLLVHIVKKSFPYHHYCDKENTSLNTGRIKDITNHNMNYMNHMNNTNSSIHNYLCTCVTGVLPKLTNHVDEIPFKNWLTQNSTTDNEIPANNSNSNIGIDITEKIVLKLKKLKTNPNVINHEEKLCEIFRILESLDNNTL